MHTHTRQNAATTPQNTTQPNSTQPNHTTLPTTAQYTQNTNKNTHREGLPGPVEVEGQEHARVDRVQHPLRLHVLPTGALLPLFGVGRGGVEWWW